MQGYIWTYSRLLLLQSFVSCGFSTEGTLTFVSTVHTTVWPTGHTHLCNLYTLSSSAQEIKVVITFDVTDSLIFFHFSEQHCAGQESAGWSRHLWTQDISGLLFYLGAHLFICFRNRSHLVGLLINRWTAAVLCTVQDIVWQSIITIVNVVD